MLLRACTANCEHAHTYTKGHHAHLAGVTSMDCMLRALVFVVLLCVAGVVVWHNENE